MVLLSFFIRFCCFYHWKYFRALSRTRKYAFYEFHAWREIPLALIIQLGILITLAARIYQTIIDYKYQLNHDILDQCLKIQLNPDFCEKENDKLMISASYALRQHTRFNLGETLTTAIVFLAFFILRKPHDCFECLSINPKVRVSIFQFSKEERQARKKFSKIGNMIDYRAQ